MSSTDFNDLKRHIDHNIVCVSYGSPIKNVAIECLDCCEVLLDYDKENKNGIPKRKITK